jgi:hypothetical protein
MLKKWIDTTIRAGIFLVCGILFNVALLSSYPPESGDDHGFASATIKLGMLVWFLSEVLCQRLWRRLQDRRPGLTAVKRTWLLAGAFYIGLFVVASVMLSRLSR